MNVKIVGTGSHVPNNDILNERFLENTFYDVDGVAIANENSEIIAKFQSITGIEQRKYTSPVLNSSDLATEAAKIAIADAGIDPETLDYIILAQNVGDITDPSRAAKDEVISNTPWIFDA